MAVAVRLHLLCIGTRMPAWVQTAVGDYCQRLPRECALVVQEIAAAKRGKSTPVERIVQDEGQRLLAAIPTRSRIIVLDERGESWSTEDLAQRLTDWLPDGRDVALLVGGPDGLSPACRAAAERIWSLSRLTLPHPLVRIVVAEQLYRAWSLLNNHPYHRA